MMHHPYVSDVESGGRPYERWWSVESPSRRASGKQPVKQPVRSVAGVFPIGVAASSSKARMPLDPMRYLQLLAGAHGDMTSCACSQNRTPPSATHAEFAGS